MNPHAKRNVLVNRNWERVGSLEHHAYRLAQLRQRYVRIVDVFAEYSNLAGGRYATIAFIDAIETTEQCGLAATRGPNQRSDVTLLDGCGYLLERLKLPVPKVEVFGHNCRSSANRIGRTRTGYWVLGLQ